MESRLFASYWKTYLVDGQKTLEINDIKKLSPKLRLSSISLDLDLMAG